MIYRLLIFSLVLLNHCFSVFHLKFIIRCLNFFLISCYRPMMELKTKKSFPLATTLVAKNHPKHLCLGFVNVFCCDIFCCWGPKDDVSGPTHNFVSFTIQKKGVYWPKDSKVLVPNTTGHFGEAKRGEENHYSTKSDKSEKESTSK